MADTTSGQAIYDFWGASIKRTNNPAIASAIAAQNQPANIPSTTVTSSPKKKILPATPIPTLPSKPIKLADVNIPNSLPKIPNIQPMESMGNKIGGSPVDTKVTEQPKDSGETTPSTPPMPSDTGATSNTSTGTTNSTDKKGEADLPKYDVLKQFGDIEILGKATSYDSSAAERFAKLNAVQQAAIKLSVPQSEDGGGYNINAYDTRKDSHLYKNADGTFTYESKYRVQYLNKITKEDKEKEKKAQEEEKRKLKEWMAEDF
jgi:hypothetical protein